MDDHSDGRENGTIEGRTCVTSIMWQLLLTIAYEDIASGLDSFLKTRSSMQNMTAYMGNI